MENLIITIRPTEKAYGLINGQSTYIFNVPLSANKQQIAAAVENEYGVKVASVKTLVQSGKAVRFSRGKNRYPGTTSRKDSKKAYVTLSEGEIKVFEEPEAPKSEEKK